MSENKKYGTDIVLLFLFIGVIIGAVGGVGAVMILSAAEPPETTLPPETTSLAGTIVRVETTLLNRYEVESSYTKAVPLYSFLYVVDLENEKTIPHRVSFIRGGEYCSEGDVTAPNSRSSL